jgi:serine protease
MIRTVPVTAGLVFSALLLSGCGGGGSGGSAEDPPPGSFPSTVALAGTINIEANTRVDLDTADNLAFGQDPLSDPQVLPANFVLAGYVSEVEGDYPPLNGLQASSYVADPVDEFRVPLKSGETLVLQSFAARAADSVSDSKVTLSLTTVGGTLLDDATTDPETGKTDVRVTLPSNRADDEYRVVIETLGQAPVRYAMSSQANVMAAGQSFEWADYEFMPGEAIVTTAPGGGRDVSAAMSASGATMSRALGENTWLARAPLTVMQQQSTARSTLRWVDSLRKAPGVSSAIPNYRMSSQAPTAEPLYPRQWHFSLIDAPTAWQLEPEGGAGVTVAVLDTGLFRQSASSWHSDLNANVVSGELLAGSDFVDGDDLPADPGNSVGNSVYHGTHVAGTVAAVVNGSGGTGMAFGSSLLPVRVLGEGGAGSSADLLDAIRWVGGLDDGRNPRADIANMSLGGLPFIQPLQDAITAASDKGVIFVAAAGNSNTSVPSYPAAFEDVFSVSAVDGGGALASYSNFGNWIDLAAPGGDATRDANSDGVADQVLSTSAAFVDGELKPVYIGLQGTSMAAPHFAGVLALMTGAREGAELNYDIVLPWLINGDLTNSSSAGRTDDLGYGVLDAGKALFTAKSDPALTILSSSPSLVSLNSETQLSEKVTLTVLGDQTQPVSIQSVRSGQSWFDVSEATNTGDDTFTLEVWLIPEELEPGVAQRGTITVNYTSDGQRTLDIPVSGQRITDQQARNAGRHFVLLVEPEPNDEGFYESVAIAPVMVSDGQYRFTFLHEDGTEPRPVNQVPPGKYLLVAGSDFDNDSIICQAGEACAEYPISGLRQEIEITSDKTLSGIEMTTSYSRPMISSLSPAQLPRPDFQGYRLMLKDENRDMLKNAQKFR